MTLVRRLILDEGEVAFVVTDIVPNIPPFRSYDVRMLSSPAFSPIRAEEIIEIASASDNDVSDEKEDAISDHQNSGCSSSSSGSSDYDTSIDGNESRDSSSGSSGDSRGDHDVRASHVSRVGQDVSKDDDENAIGEVLYVSDDSRNTVPFPLPPNRDSTINDVESNVKTPIVGSNFLNFLVHAVVPDSDPEDVIVIDETESPLLDRPLIRTKRTICEWCGEQMHYLFGVVDAEHARELAENHNKLANETELNYVLIQNSTAINLLYFKVNNDNWKRMNDTLNSLSKKFEMFNKTFTAPNMIFIRMTLNEIVSLSNATI